jgi:hydrogenase expression/formation protein HypD
MNQAVPAVRTLAAELAAITTRPWTLMEVCGGQTHAIVRWGLDQLLPPGMRLIHGPGCPVCVTPAATIDAALQLARRPEVILCSYGDMLRVPGSASGDDLLGVRAGGGDVRLLTSPLQAIELALAHPERQVVFLAVGFETTAPATALLARQALALGLANLSLLVAHVRVAPAMAAILADPANRVQGFLAAGHVGSVMGLPELEAISARYRVPVVVTGFEPADLLRGLLACVRRLEAGRPGLENAYGQVVRAEGNPAARALLAEVFTVVDRPWRGLGVIPGGGLDLASAYAELEARRRFGLEGPVGDEERGPCIAGQVLQGRATPDQCPAFGRDCTPEHPLGAPMVSSEGACAAWFRYRPAGVGGR